MTVATRKWIILALAVIITVLATILLNIDPAVQAGLPGYVAAEPDQEEPGEAPDEEAQQVRFNDIQLAFSHPDHFYDSDINVSITASIPEAVIYFTLDGSEPTVDSELYSKPIFIKAYGKNENLAVTIKAIAVVDDIVSRPLVHSYFVSTDVFERFDTMIFVLSTNDEYLYDYDTGIFVEGITREEYRRDNPRARINPPSPANFNWRGMEGERPVYIEAFEATGERVVAQAGGMRVHGGWSRAALQKSIRLVARNMYEPGEGKFHFDFFPEDTINDGFDTPLRKYDQLVLRNGANDRDFAMLRNEVGYELARMMEIQMVSPVRPAAIFLNGEYYGFAWLQVRMNAQYLQDKFNAPTRDFQIIGMGERWIDTDDPDERSAIEYLHRFYDRNLGNSRIYEEFEQLIDVDQIIRYYALQTFLGNNDWPHNNLKLWRYTGPQVEGLAPELDGRWRYIAFDLDWILGLYEDPPDVHRPTFQEMMDPRNDRYSYMLNALFENPDFVDKFAIAMCDIAANVVTQENVSSLINELFGAARNEIGHAFAAKRYANWVSFDTVAGNHRNMRLVAGGRYEYIFQSLQEHFDWDDGMFTVEVTGAEAYVGFLRSSGARYFDHLVIPLRPVLPENHVFDHWIVSGKRVDTPEITVSIADAVGGVVTVELILREELPLLMFNDAFGSSERNGCVLFNPGSEVVYTDGMYMTNDPTIPYLWALPDARVEPGGILEFAGRGSRAPEDLHSIRMGFNVRHGQRLFLCDENGEVITHIFIR